MKKKKVKKATTTKAKAFAKMLSTKIGTANKALAEIPAKPIYDSEYLNLAIGKALNGIAMPADKNAREWCATNGVVVDVRKMVHENKKDKVSCLRPENTVRQRLETLSKVDKQIAKVAYCRKLVNGTSDACDPTNDDAYLVFIYLTK